MEGFTPMKRLMFIGICLLLGITTNAELSEKKMLKDATAISTVLANNPDQFKKIDKPVWDIIWNGDKGQRKWLATRLLELDIHRLSYESQIQYLSWIKMLIKYQCIGSSYFTEIANGRSYAEREKAMSDHLLYGFYPGCSTEEKLQQAMSVLNEVQTFLDLDTGEEDDDYLRTIKTELLALRTVFLESIFYGTTDYAASHYPNSIQSDAARRVAASLSYSAFIDDPRLLVPYIRSLGEEQNALLWNIFPDLFTYAYCHLSQQDLSEITARMRAYANSTNQGHTLEEMAFSAVQKLVPTAFMTNSSRFTAMQANNDQLETIMRFIELKQQLEQEGREFVQYHPLYCPMELRQDTLYERYRDLYLRSGFAFIKEINLNAGGLKAYVHNPANIAGIKEIIRFFGYETDEISWDNQLVYFVIDLGLMAKDVYYLTNQSWLMGACMESAGAMTQLFDEWNNAYIIYALADMLPLFESTGNKDFAKSILENYGVPALEIYPTHKPVSKEMDCFDTEICAKMLPYLTLFEDNRYAELAEQVNDKLQKHIRKSDCNNALLMPYIGEYYYQLHSPKTVDFFREYMELTQDTVYAYLVFIGYYVDETHEYEKAVPYADWLVERYPEILIEAFTYDGLAATQMYAHLGRAQDALTQLRLLEQHLRHDLNVKLLASSDDQSAQIIESYANVNNRFVQLLTDTLPDELQREFSKSFYDWQLLSKGLLLALNKEKETILANHPSPYIRQLYGQLQSIQKQLSEQANIHSVEAQVLQVDRDIAQNNLQQALQSYIDFHGFDGLNLTHWPDIRQALRPDEVAIEFVSGTMDRDTIPTYFALLVRHDSEQPQLIRLFHEDSIRPYIRNKREMQIYNIPEVNQAVSHMIIHPLQSYIRPGETVYFAATGVLHQIALENMELDDTLLVSDVYRMRRLSSTRQLVLSHMEQALTPADSVVLYGGIRYEAGEEELLRQSNRYPEQRTAYRDISDTDMDRGSVSFLQGTLLEVNAIDTMLSVSRQAHTLLSDLQANEESFKALSGTNTVLLHIATHGFFWKKESALLQTYTSGGVSDEQVLRRMDPLRRCGLLMAGANTALRGHAADLPQGVQDGVLTGQEIALLDLSNTRVAILSACETGVGEITGDGVFGLQRAFKKAGVQTLIMSLWKVSDAATQLLMTEFYRNWITLHQSKREAFRNAQNKVRTLFEEPTYWAGFIMLD